MTTLYRPVLIESAEQAEALPEGTVTIGTRYGVIEKGSRGSWWAGLAELPDRIAVGGTALVPIEAGEERAVSHDRDAPAWSSVTKERAQSPGVGETAFVRYVTPWEEA